MNYSVKYNDIKGTIGRLEGVVETVLLTVIYYLVWKAFYSGEYTPGYIGSGKFILMGIYGVLVFVLFFLCEGFKFGHLKLTDVVVSQWISLIIVDFITYFQLCLIANGVIDVKPFLLLLLIDIAVSFSCCFLFTFFYHMFYVPHNMLLIYGSKRALKLKFKMDTRSDKYTITEFISADADYETIKACIDKHDAVILNDVSAKERNDILKYCYQHKIRTYLVPKTTDIVLRGAQDITLFDTPLLLVKGVGLSPAQRLIKRIFDIVCSLIALVIASPIMLVVALAIKLDDGGPIFYKQDRVTRGGKVFDILKFRSMIVDAEKGGKSIPATDNDPRITRVGRIIRAIRIDELPQIINILKGDMSVCGPRPERCSHYEEYCKEIPEFEYRTKVKGGLTGFAQVYGKYNTSPYDKLRFDLMYIENYSLLLDIKLILMTIRILFKKESTEGFDKIVDETEIDEIIK